MDRTNTPGGSSDFQQELLALLYDPQVRSLAQRWADGPDPAEDILQAAFLAAATRRRADSIDDLRAYFTTVLRHESYGLYQLRRITPLEDPETALGPGQHGTVVCGPAPARPVDETAHTSLQSEAWLSRLPRPARLPRGGGARPLG